MLNLDLKARMKNKTFWVSLISAIVLLVQRVGYKDLIPANYADIVNSVLGILVMLGILIDPSTNGISDGNNFPNVTTTTIVNTQPVSNENTISEKANFPVSDASSKITVDNPDNIKEIGQTVNVTSASNPQ